MFKFLKRSEQQSPIENSDFDAIEILILFANADGKIDKNEKENIRNIEGMPKETGLVDAFVIKPEIFIKYLDKKVKLNMEEIKLIEAGKDKCQ